jgi:seryl-tRNA synthetase
MHDIEWIRRHPELFDAALSRRQLEPAAAHILSLDQQRRQAITQLQQLLQQRNQLNEAMAKCVNKAGPEFAAMKQEATAMKAHLAQMEVIAADEQALDEVLCSYPNILLPEVPEGIDEEANQELRRWGEPTSPVAKPKLHFELGETLGLMDFTQTALISGSRFVTLFGALARMERALAQFMLDIHTKEFGYTEVAPPYMVRDEAMYAAGQLPKFAADSFLTTTQHRLIPTAEVPITTLAMDKILDGRTLPLRYTAYSPCFRSEAGSAGKDTRGMFRQHQFTKVELVSLVTAEQGAEEHERMTNAAETVLQRLGIPYRVMLLSAGDTGFCSRKTYDLEVWLPGQDRYREISSCSYFGDFIGRRMRGRYRMHPEEPTQPLHTLNGSGLAIGRTIVAILENYQQEDGTIMVPEALRPLMGCEKIG